MKKGTHTGCVLFILFPSKALELEGFPNVAQGHFSRAGPWFSRSRVYIHSALLCLPLGTLLKYSITRAIPQCVTPVFDYKAY